MQRYIAEYHQISPYGVVTAAAANARRGGLGPAGGGGSTAPLRGRGRMEGRSRRGRCRSGRVAGFPSGCGEGAAVAAEGKAPLPWGGWVGPPLGEGLP